MAPAQKIQQVPQKLPNIRSPHKISQMQIAQPPPQVNPQVRLVQHAKISLRTLEQIKTVIMKRRGMHASLAHERAHALAQFSRRILRISKRENLLRLRVPFLEPAAQYG